MRRSRINLVIDALTLALILLMVASGLVIRFVLPPGSGGHRHTAKLTLWHLSRHDWGDLHFWISVVLGAILFVHVAMHWAWACETVRRWHSLPVTGLKRLTRQARLVYGVLTIVAVLIVISAFLWIARASVRHHQLTRRNEIGAFERRGITQAPPQPRQLKQHPTMRRCSEPPCRPILPGQQS